MFNVSNNSVVCAFEVLSWEAIADLGYETMTCQSFAPFLNSNKALMNKNTIYHLVFDINFLDTAAGENIGEVVSAEEISGGSLNDQWGSRRGDGGYKSCCCLLS